MLQFSNDVRVEMSPQPVDVESFGQLMQTMVRAPLLPSAAQRAAQPLLETHGLTYSSAASHLTTHTVLSVQHRMNGGTNISLAVQKAGQLLKPLGEATRRVLVLLTDGRVDSHQVSVSSLVLLSLCGCWAWRCSPTGAWTRTRRVTIPGIARRAAVSASIEAADMSSH